MHVALEGRTGQRWELFERLRPVCLRRASRVVHLAQQAPHRALGLALVRVVHVYGRDRASPVTRRASLAGLNADSTEETRNHRTFSKQASTECIT